MDKPLMNTRQIISSTDRKCATICLNDNRVTWNCFRWRENERGGLVILVNRFFDDWRDVIVESASSKDIMGNLENVERMQGAYSTNVRHCRDNIQLLNIIPLLLLGKVLRYTDECCNHFRWWRITRGSSLTKIWKTMSANERTMYRFSEISIERHILCPFVAGSTSHR